MVLVVKNLPASAGEVRDTASAWVEKILWKRKWQPTPVFLPGKFHEKRAYSLWGHKRVRQG